MPNDPLSSAMSSHLIPHQGPTSMGIAVLVNLD